LLRASDPYSVSAYRRARSSVRGPLKIATSQVT
jgi:hypothetical protein